MAPQRHLPGKSPLLPRSHHLLVPATYGEAFGLYAIEAIASGVPVVQPDHGGFPEIIEATKGGILCKPDNLNALVDGLDSLLQDDLRRDQITTAGIPAVREINSATKMAEGFEQVLANLH